MNKLPKIPEISEDVKERLVIALAYVEKTIHWGFVPLVLYLGYRKGAEPGMPPITLMSMLGF
ncbi:mitochondrial import receptor subunit TOM7 homolog [Drosophila persimilis]|uniref:mitochondrial import receptor subunit TOM7 homolog n=1 Tax=Drosophila persimilis TaxID=7234 RepID=UPI000F078F73|nr:mitochondrial import receptor subunit TOM7 homolog [Drosophila persimilis]